ncbi:MAG TPA: molybdate ABC transporter permease subunit, partial [Calditrichia bacterium]|nr:molybdate ABC transporter permease subunit [Calditrichia bacterium]
MTDLLPIVALSLKTALAATLLILPPGVWLGWLLARRNFPGKTLLEGLVNIPLVLPPVVTGY